MPVALGLLVAARAHQAFQQQEWPRTDVIPFESQHRFMASLHHDHAGHGFVYLKGAPERVLEMSTRLATADGEHVISMDCENCHAFLVEDADEPPDLAAMISG